MDIDQLRNDLRAFSERRHWDQFHTPKNLVMALASEAGELLDLFRWLTPEESASIKNSPERIREVRHEVADVLIYLVRLADKLDIDLEAAVRDKIKLNEERYPVDKAWNSAEKYSRRKDS